MVPSLVEALVAVTGAAEVAVAEVSEALAVVVLAAAVPAGIGKILLYLY